MGKYLMIESRDCFEYGDAPYFIEQAQGLASKGNDVTMFLLQNGVLMARKGVDNNPVAKIAKSKVKVLADDFGLRARGISQASMLDGIGVSNVDQLVDMLAQEGVKAVWH